MFDNFTEQKQQKSVIDLNFIFRGFPPLRCVALCEKVIEVSTSVEKKKGSEGIEPKQTPGATAHFFVGLFLSVFGDN